MLPIVNTIKSYWPSTDITWVIGKTEHALVHTIPGVEWIVFDKSLGIGAYRAVRRQLAGRSFDLLLLMQLSLRANLVPLLARINARRRLGFDRARSRDLHSVAVNRRIAPRRNEHVLDSFFGFTDHLAMERRLVWDRCCEPDDEAAVEELTGTEPYFLISPCSSHVLRNWSPARYARVADHVCDKYGMNIVLSGAPVGVESMWCKLVECAMKNPAINLAGRTTVRQVAALVSKSVAMLAPDSGPAHLATACGTPVASLFAATNPDRAAPYLCRQWSVNRYPDVVRTWLGKEVQSVAWGTKVERPGVMDLITVDDAVQKVDEMMAAQA